MNSRSHFTIETSHYSQVHSKLWKHPKELLTGMSSKRHSHIKREELSTTDKCFDETVTALLSNL